MQGLSLNWKLFQLSQRGSELQAVLLSLPLQVLMQEGKQLKIALESP